MHCRVSIDNCEMRGSMYCRTTMRMNALCTAGLGEVVPGDGSLDVDPPQGFRLRVRHPTSRTVVNTYPPPTECPSFESHVTRLDSMLMVCICISTGRSAVFIQPVSLGGTANGAPTTEATRQAVQADIHMGWTVPAAIITRIERFASLDHFLTSRLLDPEEAEKCRWKSWATLFLTLVTVAPYLTSFTSSFQSITVFKRLRSLFTSSSCFLPASSFISKNCWQSGG
jgi:hypothetical protein